MLPGVLRGAVCFSMCGAMCCAVCFAVQCAVVWNARDAARWDALWDGQAMGGGGAAARCAMMQAVPCCAVCCAALYLASWCAARRGVLRSARYVLCYVLVYGMAGCACSCLLCVGAALRRMRRCCAVSFAGFLGV